MNYKGIFVMVDGMDLSGKGTAISALKEWSERQGKSIFDLREYNKKMRAFPQAEELEGYDVILSAEPTHAWAGAAIREEIITNNGRDYSAKETAEAYSNDRLVLYKRIIVPMLGKGKIIFQERGNSTSLAYQPLQAEIRNEKLEMEEIMNMAGNSYTLAYPPSLLIITLSSEKTVMERKQARKEKQDNCIFEESSFQARLRERYESKWFRQIFEKLGTRIRFIDTDGITVADTKRKAVEIFEDFLKEYPQSGNIRL